MLCCFFGWNNWLAVDTVPFSALEWRDSYNFVGLKVANRYFTRPYSLDGHISVTPYLHERSMSDTTKNDTTKNGVTKNDTTKNDIIKNDTEWQNQELQNHERQNSK